MALALGQRDVDREHAFAHDQDAVLRSCGRRQPLLASQVYDLFAVFDDLRRAGCDLPWGLASHAGDAALVSLTNDTKVGTMEGPRAPQFRPLDITGKPTGPWVCLDAKIAAGLEQDMGILAEPNGGYAVTYKSPADATVLVRVDKLGTGAP